MCGIYLTNIQFSKKEIKKKLEKIKYRGPDNSGFLKENDISLAHLRLSILDLDERSNQPFKYKQLSLVYNGEIYNFKEVKDILIKEGYSFETTSDTEVLIKGYHLWGEKVLDRINGMFAFAIYDVIKNIVFIARDRIGVKPLYYNFNNAQLEICSQIQPLHKKELDKEAINIYLQTGYIPSPFSIYEGIRKLQPGHFAIFNLGSNKLKIKTYWDLKKIKLQKISYQEAKEKLHTLLIDAVKIRLQSDVPFGSFLSGGIDSAIVSAIANSIQKDKLKTFTIGFENKKFDESEVAKNFANIIKSDHHLIHCNQKDVISLVDSFFQVYDEPFADSSAIPSLLLNKKVKKHVTVALSGDGGDESFLGYNHFSWIKKVSYLFYLPLFFRRLVTYLIPFKLLGKRGQSYKNIIKMRNINEFIVSIFTGFYSILRIDNKKWMTHYGNYLFLAKDNLQKAADLNLKLWLENDSNVKVDRSSMASSVEVRSPLLDYRIIEFTRSLPTRFRFNGFTRKKILKDILSNYIPEKVFNVPKKGFSVPMAKWIRTDLKDEIKSYLTDEFLDPITSLDKKKVKYCLEQHLNHKEDFSSIIWRVYVLIKWIKINK